MDNSNPLLTAIMPSINKLYYFAFALAVISILDFLIYRYLLEKYTQIYGRREARRRAYGTGWLFAAFATPIAIWLILT